MPSLPYDPYDDYYEEPDEDIHMYELRMEWEAAKRAVAEEERALRHNNLYEYHILKGERLERLEAARRQWIADQIAAGKLSPPTADDAPDVDDDPLQF